MLGDSQAEDHWQGPTMNLLCKSARPRGWNADTGLLGAHATAWVREGAILVGARRNRRVAGRDHVEPDVHHRLDTRRHGPTTSHLPPTTVIRLRRARKSESAITARLVLAVPLVYRSTIPATRDP